MPSEIERMQDGVERRTRIARSGKRITELYYPVFCPTCGTERKLRKKDTVAGRPCSSCSQRLKGKKSFAQAQGRLSKKFGGKQGAELWAEMARQQHERKRTPSELQFEALIQGMRYETNAVLHLEGRYWIADFVIEGRIVVEINGGVHILHQERDRKKYGAYLRAGYTLIVMEVQDVSLNWLFKGLC